MEDEIIRKPSPKGRMSATLFLCLMSFFSGAAFWATMETQAWVIDFFGFAKKTVVHFIAPPENTARTMNMNAP